MKAAWHWALSARPFPYRKQTAGSAMALLYLAGGATTLLISLLPHPPTMQGEIVLAIGVTSPIVGVAIHLLRDRLPAAVYPWLLATGTGIVTTLVAAGGGGSTSVSLSFFYMWIAVYSVLFFRPIVAALELLLVAAAYGMVLARMDAFSSGGSTATEPIVLAAVVGTTAAVILLLSRAREVSELDPLTGVVNRRGLERILDEAIEHAPREHEPLVLSIIDIDHFKRINDERGHQAGDRILQRLTDHWRAVLRAGDTVARIGGDEFVIVLPACSIIDAGEILDRLRAGGPDRVTCSIGTTEFRPGDSASLLMTRADTALYEAKRRGRDQTAWAT